MSAAIAGRDSRPARRLPGCPCAPAVAVFGVGCSLPAGPRRFRRGRSCTRRRRLLRRAITVAYKSPLRRPRSSSATSRPSIPLTTPLLNGSAGLLLSTEKSILLFAPSSVLVPFAVSRCGGASGPWSPWRSRCSRRPSCCRRRALLSGGWSWARGSSSRGSRSCSCLLARASRTHSLLMRIAAALFASGAFVSLPSVFAPVRVQPLRAILGCGRPSGRRHTAAAAAHPPLDPAANAPRAPHDHFAPSRLSGLDLASIGVTGIVPALLERSSSARPFVNRPPTIAGLLRPVDFDVSAMRVRAPAAIFFFPTRTTTGEPIWPPDHSRRRRDQGRQLHSVSGLTRFPRRETSTASRAILPQDKQPRRARRSWGSRRASGLQLPRLMAQHIRHCAARPILSRSPPRRRYFRPTGVRRAQPFGSSRAAGYSPQLSSLFTSSCTSRRPRIGAREDQARPPLAGLHRRAALRPLTLRELDSEASCPQSSAPISSSPSVPSFHSATRPSRRRAHAARGTCRPGLPGVVVDSRGDGHASERVRERSCFIPGTSTAPAAPPSRRRSGHRSFATTFSSSASGLATQRRASLRSLANRQC